MNLYLLNALRWVRHHAIAWSVLFASYSIAAAVVVQVLLQELLRSKWPFFAVWLLTAAVVAIPGALERIPVPGAIGGAWAHRLGQPFGKVYGSLGRIYITHELRRPATWLGVLITAAGGVLAFNATPAAWLLLCLIPAQRAFFSVSHWRRLAAFYRPRAGAHDLMLGFAVAQVFQVIAIALILNVGVDILEFVSETEVAFKIPGIGGPGAGAAGGAAAGGSGGAGAGEWAGFGWSAALANDFARVLRFALAALGASLAAAAMVMEGDSGRPWLVNFIGLAAGFIGAVTSWATPWAIPVIVYFLWRMTDSVQRRLKSVENPDEDIVIP